MKITVGVLMGGSSAEREISYKSAENIINSLNEDTYRVIAYDIPVNDHSWIGRIENDRPDIVLNALHGGKGEDGGVQGVLSCLNIPFVGSGVEASALCMDKAMCKQVMRAKHIPVIDGVLIKRGKDQTAAYDRAERLGYPLIAKPNKGGSSLGIRVVNSLKELKEAVDNIFTTYRDDALVERYISGREVTCGVLQRGSEYEVISLLDITKDSEFFDYKEKYLLDGCIAGISSLPEYMQESIRGIAVKTCSIMGCRGYACVDMLLMEEQVYVIEVNTLPGMTATSLIPTGLKAKNIELGDFLDSLIKAELEAK